MKLLILTGAGASRNLSSDPDRLLPLMDDWRPRLRQGLGEPLYDMCGLNGATDGQEFEATLGRALRVESMLSEMEHLSGLSKVPAGPDDVLHRFREGLGNMRNNLARLTEVLHVDLFEEFGPDRFDDHACASAYSKLFERLDIEAPYGNVVIATTNYDRSIELAFDRLDLDIKTGAIPHRFRNSYLDPAHLGQFDPTSPSLLYLHGAVGWYSRDDGQVLCASADDGYRPDRGRPTVLYPDPEKEIERLETSVIWAEFREALADATHVVVVGHSLHDKHVAGALTDAASAGRTKVAVLAHTTGLDGSARKLLLQYLRAKSGSRYVVEGVFGPTPDLGDDTVWSKFCDEGSVEPA